MLLVCQFLNSLGHVRRRLTTKAHIRVIVYRTPASNLRVRLGEHNIRDTTERYPHEEYTVRRKIVNEGFDRRNFVNDIALLELAQPVIYREHIIPICLPEKGANFTGELATVAGWGRVKYGQSYMPSSLQKVDVQVCNSQLYIDKTRLICWFKHKFLIIVKKRFYKNNILGLGYTSTYCASLFECAVVVLNFMDTDKYR